jgi:hypothetical protein
MINHRRNDVKNSEVALVRAFMLRRIGSLDGIAYHRAAEVVLQSGGPMGETNKAWDNMRGELDAKSETRLRAITPPSVLAMPIKGSVHQDLPSGAMKQT